MTDNNQFLEKEKQIISTVKQLETQVNDYTKWAWRSVIGGLVVLIIALVLFFVPNFEEFAKFLGSIVAAIWTLSGLFFVYVAFLGQKQSIQNQQLELFYNREELKATREELAGQKQQMIEQNKTLKQQQFENTFFKLLEKHTEFVNSINFFGKKGVSGLSFLYENYFLKERYEQLPKENNFTEFEKIKLSFGKKETYQNILYPYFSNLFYSLKFIDEMCDGNKEFYIKLLRGQLSPNEKLTVFYYSIAFKNLEFSELLKKYKFFKRLDEKTLIKKEHKKFLKEYKS